MAYVIIPTYAYAESTYSVTFGDVLVRLTTRYNYSAECWTLDIADYEDQQILSGIMLVPWVDLLKPYPAITALIGSLQVVERTTGAYMLPDSLGTDVKLLWYAPGEAIA